MRTGAAYLLVCIALIGCGGGARKAENVGSEQAPPQALVVERVISGNILGKPLRNPTGLAVGPHGHLFVSDTDNHRVISLDRELTPRRDIGGFGVEPGLFNRPGYLTIDNALSLLITDPGNRRVARYDPQLNYVNEISLVDIDDPLANGSPGGVAITSYGETWVTDRDKNRIIVYSNVDRFDRYIGDYGYAGGELLHPRDISYHDDRFYVCDVGNQRIAVYDTYGNFEREIFHETMYEPVGVDVGRTGGVWVTDRQSNTVLLFTRRGQLRFTAGPQLAGTDESLERPSDVCVLGPERLAIADSGNNRILVCRMITTGG